MPRQKKLGTSAYIMLGLLCKKKYTSYEMNQRIISSTFQKVWPSAASSLYLEPHKLVAYELATVELKQREGRPYSEYKITKKGRAAFKVWLLADSQRGFEVCHENAVRFMFGKRMKAPDLKKLLKELNKEALDDVSALHLKPLDNRKNPYDVVYRQLEINLLKVRLDWIHRATEAASFPDDAETEIKKVYMKQQHQLLHLFREYDNVG